MQISRERLSEILAEVLEAHGVDSDVAKEILLCFITEFSTEFDAIEFDDVEEDEDDDEDNEDVDNDDESFLDA